MRLNSLRLVNFRQHEDSRLTFDSGLTGIIGPNGSGKTTILEAIAWALYGNSAARGTRESIRFSRAPARASVRVELDFDMAGHRYLVVRGLTNAELYLDGGEQPIANSITGVTELLQRRLGMTRGEFFNTYFTGQKELNVMAAMGPSDRAKFLSRVLGYEKLRTAQDLVRERRKLITAETAGLRSGMPDRETVQQMVHGARSRVADAERRAADAERRRADAEGGVARIAPEWDTLQRERERLQELLSDLKVAERDQDELARDGERIAGELRDVATARRELEPLRQELDAFPAIVHELQQADERYREEGRRQTLLETERSVADELARLRERRVRLETAPSLEEEVTIELETRRRELEDAQGELEARRTEWVRDRQEAETKLQALRTQFADLRQQRERLVAAGEEGACPTCARPLGGGHYQTVLDLLTDQAETVRVDGNYFKARLEQLEQMPPEVKALDERRRLLQQDVGLLERRLAKVQLAVQELQQVARDVSSKEQRQAVLQREIAAIPGGYDAERHTHLKARWSGSPLWMLARRGWGRSSSVSRSSCERRRGWKPGRGRCSADSRGYASGATRSASRRSRTRPCEIDMSGRRSRLTLPTSRWRRRGPRWVPHTKRSRRPRRGGASWSGCRAGWTCCRARSVCTTSWIAHTPISGLTSTSRCVPSCPSWRARSSPSLTDGRYSELELDDQYNVIVLEDSMPKPVISGGEEDIANLVLRLAISQMIAERAGQSFSLLILDEVFGSLDETRRHNVVELLRRLHDRFEQVIVITHMESVRDGLDRVITVRYDEEHGTSVVEPGRHGAAGRPRCGCGA